MTLTAVNGTQPETGSTLRVLHKSGGVLDDRDFFLEALMPLKTQLYNFIRKAMNFHPDADDVFQETLLKGFRYLHSFNRERSFKTWIFTIAHNNVKDRFKPTHYTEQLLAEEMEQLAVEEPGFNQEVREIYIAAGSLKARQREVFFLYYYNEFTVMEIAGITRLSRANVKFILHQARNVIKKIVEVKQ